MLTRLEILADRPAAYAAGLWSPIPGVRLTIVTPPSVAFPARISTHAPRHRRPDCCPPLNEPICRAPATTTNCLAASDGGGRFAMFRARHRRLCDRPQAAMGSGIDHPLAFHRRSNSDYARGMYSGEIESLERDPGIATLDPGMQFPGN